MLKKLLTLWVLILLCALVAANISLVTETSKTTLKKNETHTLGSVQRGETIELTISSNPGYEKVKAEWFQLVIPKDSLPEGWTALDSDVNRKTLTARIAVPLDAALDAFEFKAKAVSQNKQLNDESVTLRVYVKKGLVLSSVSQTVQETLVNQPVVFELTLINNSVANHRVLVSSNLPSLWFKEQEILVKAGEEKKIALEVTPRVYGSRPFYFVLSSLENSQTIDLIEAQLNVNPVLKEKYATAFYGFPFFTLSLLPYYLINAFISLLMP